jgi:hypothetical protein
VRDAQEDITYSGRLQANIMYTAAHTHGEVGARSHNYFGDPQVSHKLHPPAVPSAAKGLPLWARRHSIARVRLAAPFNNACMRRPELIEC